MTFIRERTPQKTGEKGSLKWIQRIIGSHPAILTTAIRSVAHAPADWTIDWKSPRADDEWAEYRDGGFLQTVGHASLTDALAEFWPTGGPQWDALGVASDGRAIIVEAKAHVGELSSSCGAGEASRSLISASLEEACTALDAKGGSWLEDYYQYANRLAHLHFLNRNGAKAWLVFVYFYNDVERKGPTSVQEWKDALQNVYDHLGLPASPPGVLNIFIDVNTLT